MELEFLPRGYRYMVSQGMTIKDLKCVNGVVLFLGDKALTIKIPLQRRG